MNECMWVQGAICAEVSMKVGGSKDGLVIYKWLKKWRIENGKWRIKNGSAPGFKFGRGDIDRQDNGIAWEGIEFAWEN